MPYTRRILLILSGVMLATSLTIFAGQAKPVPKFIAPADAIRLYWTDAPNHFKAVRSVQPKHQDEDSATYDLIVVPQGAAVWLDDFYNATVSVKQGRYDLRNGQPQVKLGLFAARVTSKSAAQSLFKEWKSVALGLPGAQLRGDQYPNFISIWTKGRANRRSLTLQVSDEPEDGAYVISLDVSFNEDDPLDGGGGGG
jgi:hypothetical protein